MASYQAPPSKPFNFTTSEEWLKWIRGFKRLRQASGLSKRNLRNQVNTLVYTMGNVADDILSLCGLPEDDKAKYDMVAKFKAHFVKKTENVIL